MLFRSKIKTCHHDGFLVVILREAEDLLLFPGTSRLQPRPSQSRQRDGAVAQCFSFGSLLGYASLTSWHKFRVSERPIDIPA